jgi:Flp pilus assembly protein TadB
MARDAGHQGRSNVQAREWARGVDNQPSGADNTSAMHAQTAHQSEMAAAHRVSALSVAAVLPVSSLMILPVVVAAVVVAIIGIVIIRPAGGVLG